MINKPQFPPKAGYVEVVDSNGNHVYRPIASQLKEESQDKLLQSLKESDESLSNQTTDLQLAMCEQYENSENQLTDIQMALCEVYELLQGGTT